MTYIFWNFLLCMLLAAVIGGILGWLLRGFFLRRDMEDLEAEWRNKLGLAENERETLSSRLRDADGVLAGWRQKFASLEADHGKLQADFSATSGRIPALEASVAGWNAKATEWEGERVRLMADLSACGKFRGVLEAQIAEWNARAKVWDTERAQLEAKLAAAKAELTNAIASDVSDDAAFQAKIDQLGSDIGGLKSRLAAAEAAARDWESRHAAVSAELSKAKTADRVDDAQFEKAIALLQSDVAGLQAKLSAAERHGRQWEGQHASVAAALAAAQTQVTDWEAKFRALEGEHEGIKAELVKFSQDDAFEDADFKRTIQNMRNKISSLESQVSSVSQERDKALSERDRVAAELKSAMSEDAVEDTKYQQTIAQLRAEIAALQQSGAALESDTRKLRAEHKAAQTQVSDWEAKFRGLASEHDGIKAELAKFSQDDAFEDADFKRTIQNMRNKISSLESQVSSVSQERDKALSERDRVAAELKTAMSEDAVEDTKYQQTIGQLRGEVTALQTKGSSLESELSRIRAELKAANADRAKLSMELSSGSSHGDASEAMRAEQAGLQSRLASLERATADWAARYAALEAKTAAPAAMAAAAGAGAGAAAVTQGSDPNFHALARRFETFLVKTQREGFGDIERIEGIGPVYGQKLRSIGIAWVRELLEQGGSPNGRERISDDSGIKRDLILKWVNSADLLRIDGVTPDWAELLEESGVDTVKELRGRVPENLQRKLTETNEQGKHAKSVPDVDTVRRWVEQAKRLDPKVSH